MNKVDTHNPELTGDEALALDHVLGILVEPQRSRALKRIEEDAAFAWLVSRYRARLASGSAGMCRASEGPVQPRAEIWDAILARISEADRL
jgi:anti-sigma-K factor RskA